MNLKSTVIASLAALTLGLAAVSPAAAIRLGGGGGGWYGGGGDGQTGAEAGYSGDVHALLGLGHGAADDDIFDLFSGKIGDSS